MSETLPEAVSYCIVCDALPGGCDHNGRRYLDPIVYEPILMANGRLVWRVPEEERWRVNNPPSTWPKQPPSTSAIPLPDLLRLVSRRAYLDDRLESQIVELYSVDSEAVTRLVEALDEKASNGKLRNPAGFLASRLKDLGRRAHE